MKKENKQYLKKRKSVVCDCKRARQFKDRAKFGTCRCDSFSFSYTVGIVLSNALFQYLADAPNEMVKGEWQLIEKHAHAIRDYAEADAWDEMTTVDIKDKSAIDRMYEYRQKQKAWREAMFWLTENWQSLWW